MESKEVLDEEPKKLDKIMPEIQQEVGIVTDRIKKQIEGGDELTGFDPVEFEEKEKKFWLNKK